MTTGRIVIIPFLHGKLGPDGNVREPDIDSILEKWLERHPEFRDRDFHIIRSKSYSVDENRDNLQQISERTERVKARNRIAAEIMQERGIPTNDLYELVATHPEFFSGDGVHYNGKGREVQAMQVAESVAQCLPKSK